MQVFPPSGDESLPRAQVPTPHLEMISIAPPFTLF